MATYIKEDIDACQITFRENQGDTQILAAQVGKVTVVNIYKPPRTKWRSPPIKVFEHPALYIGDFNSHNVEWGYDQNDDNGNKLQEWIVLHNMKLVYNAKEKGTFRSARWSKDLSMASRYSLSDNTMVTRRVFGNFPHSQHRPVVLDYGLQIPLIRSLPKPRWNCRKADWGKYDKELDHIIS